MPKQFDLALTGVESSSVVLVYVESPNQQYYVAVKPESIKKMADNAKFRNAIAERMFESIARKIKGEE